MEYRADLGLLSQRYPTVDRIMESVARRQAELALPAPRIHIISDIHGDDVKLRHVINNASGTLRPIVERLFDSRLTEEEIQRFLTLLFYPKEVLGEIEATLRSTDEQRGFARETLDLLVELLWYLAKNKTYAATRKVFPPEYSNVLEELLVDRVHGRGEVYRNGLVDALVDRGRIHHFIRLVVRVARNLTIDELVIGGDCWDRGPRGDRVVDYLMPLPNISFVWGNHDASWFGACLGQEALIANVLRFSLRYRRLSQLEEGYGITLQPLEKLVREVYTDDPAECFPVKGTGLRDDLNMRRMQKAAAILQFKLEGQLIARHPEFQLDHRRLLHRMDLARGTVEIDGQVRTLRDHHFPTLNPDDPYQLSPDEARCLARIRQSFLQSQRLWEHFRYLNAHGSMALVRDHHVIFHGCVPVSPAGEFLAFPIEGRPEAGKALFDAMDRVLRRAITDEATENDRDLLWYFWCGPLSPLFGKDRITTFENDLVAEPETHIETKNPYFELIHEADFCDRILREFGADPERGLIVNGHVPVKIEKGESPLKRSGKAITIDGAFSEAYGDHGYTLVLDPSATILAKHHHFESVEAAVRDGVDIIPELEAIRNWDSPRTTADTEAGVRLTAEIHLLDELAEAYRTNQLHPQPTT